MANAHNFFQLVALFAALAAVNAAIIPYGDDHSHSHHAVSYSSVSHGTPSHHGHEYSAPSLHTYQAPAVHAYAAPVVAKVAPVVAKYPVYAKEEEHYAPAHYEFEYSVHDPHTHDIKEQKEHREGDVVKGMYSLVEADGSKRIVEYTADKHNGFNAVVHREHSTHPAPAPVAKYVAAPVAKIAAIAAPVHYTHHEVPQYYHHWVA